MTNFSIVTACLNSGKTISDTVTSVMNQKNVTVEHIIKDGGSHDRTTEIVAEINPKARILIGSDTGIYDAMNQGFAHCQGDIVGFLNSDDYYADANVLNSVLETFRRTNCDVAYGDISIIDSRHRVIRQWKCESLTEGSLNARPLPHPSLFVRRDVLAGLGQPFDPTYQIAGDIKQQLILIEKLRLHAEYVPKLVAIMRTGGKSSGRLRPLGWAECARAYREVHNRSGWLFVLKKVLHKLPQIRLQRRVIETKAS